MRASSAQLCALNVLYTFASVNRVAEGGWRSSLSIRAPHLSGEAENYFAAASTALLLL